MSSTLVGLLPMLLTFFGAFGMMLWLDATIAALIVLAVPLFILVSKLLGRSIRPQSARWMEAQSRLTAFTDENLRLMPIIKAFVREPTEQQRFHADNSSLLNGTVRDNLLYAKPDASAQEAEAAAEVAGAAQFIKQLPNGYDTIIGDQGIKLSGGQRQRLSLARTLLLQPRILILDESTAMFDPQGEAEFIERSRELLATRTVILITHRPASLELADRVVPIGQGQNITAR